MHLRKVIWIATKTVSSMAKLKILPHESRGKMAYIHIYIYIFNTVYLIETHEPECTHIRNTNGQTCGKSTVLSI